MGFVDGISVFTKGVGAKAKGNIDVVNLNSQLMATQKEISALYENLGKTYYENKKDCPDASVADIVNSIKEKFTQIEAINNQINSTKDNIASISLVNKAEGRICVNCGAEVAAGNLFCVKCGTRQPEIIPEVADNSEKIEENVEQISSNVADKADEVISAKEAEKAVEDTAIAEVVEEIKEADEVKEEVAKAGFCSNCGAPIYEDSSFCTQCGSRV